MHTYRTGHLINTRGQDTVTTTNRRRLASYLGRGTFRTNFSINDARKFALPRKSWAGFLPTLLLVRCLVLFIVLRT